MNKQIKIVEFEKQKEIASNLLDISESLREQLLKAEIAKEDAEHINYLRNLYATNSIALSLVILSINHFSNEK